MKNKKLQLAILTLMTVSVLSGCTKNEGDKKVEVEPTTTPVSTYEYYIENDGVYTKLDSSEISCINFADNSIVGIYFIDGTKLIVPTSDFYIFDTSSEYQRKLINDLTK